MTIVCRYCTAGVDKRVRRTSLYHCRQCIIVLKPRSDRIDYTPFALWRTIAAESWENSTSASWVWFKYIGSTSPLVVRTIHATRGADKDATSTTLRSLITAAAAAAAVVVPGFYGQIIAAQSQRDTETERERGEIYVDPTSACHLIVRPQTTTIHSKQPVGPPDCTNQRPATSLRCLDGIQLLAQSDRQTLRVLSSRRQHDPCLLLATPWLLLLPPL